MTNLLALWGSSPGRDRGEAEVLAQCKRHGWVAIMDDRQGRTACAGKGVAHCHSVSLLIGAAALGIDGLGRGEAWELHQRVEAQRHAPLLPVEDEYRRTFTDACKKFRRYWQAHGEPPWPDLLALGADLDTIVEQLVLKKKHAP